LVEEAFCLEGKLTKILVVEDNLDMQRFICEIVKTVRDEVVVDFVSNGNAALEYLNAEAPTLVITDLLMPGISGLDLIRKVHELHGMTYVRFMLVTGGLTTDFVRDLSEADIKSKFGCVVVRKPFRPAYLRQAVLNLLKEVEDAHRSLDSSLT
jgi:CheY-like chemotaxis protein